MNSNFVKLIFLAFILTIYSCSKKDNSQLKRHFVSDSINFYKSKIKTDEISDSLKKIYLEKVFNFNKLIVNDSIRIKNNDTLAYDFYNLNKFKEYKSIVDQSLKESLITKDTNRIIKSTINYGRFYFRSNKYDSAYYFFDKAQKLYISNNQYEKSNELLIDKASIQFYESDYLGCETSILKSLPYLKKEKNLNKLYRAYNLVGLSKMELKEYDEAIQYFNEGFDVLKELYGNNYLDLITLNNIGLVYFKKENYSKAIEFYLRILNNKENEEIDIQTYTYAKQYYTFSKFKLGDTDDFVIKYDEILKSYEELNFPKIQPLIQLSEYYESINDYTKSQELAIEAYNIAINENIYRDKLLVLKQLANVFPDKSKYYSKQYVKLTDSIFTIDKKAQNTFARIEYRVDELNTENQILTAKSQKIIFYTFVISLIFSSIYLYRWIKLNRKEVQFAKQQKQINREIYNLMIDEQLKIEEGRILEKEKISKELHDGVLGRLFGARMNLDYFASTSKEKFNENKEKFIDQIKDIETQIRQISHKLSDEKKAVIDNFQLMINKLISDQEAVMQNQIQFYSNIKQPWEYFSVDEKLNIYRILQETFQNINKYASAKNITFEVRQIENNIQITIQDDGIGFNTNKASKGIGLKNIYSRAEEMDADVTITSKIGNGSITKLIFNNKIKK